MFIDFFYISAGNFYWKECFSWIKHTYRCTTCNNYGLTSLTATISCSPKIPFSKTLKSVLLRWSLKQRLVGFKVKLLSTLTSFCCVSDHVGFHWEVAAMQSNYVPPWISSFTCFVMDRGTVWSALWCMKVAQVSNPLYCLCHSEPEFNSKKSACCGLYVGQMHV